MWLRPLGLMAGSGELVKIFTSDTLIGDLFTYCGSPAGPQVVKITVDGCDIGDVRITASWDSATTFEFTCINGGRICGLGGDGGDGGGDYGDTGEAGSHGSDGGTALSSNGFALNVDIDDGYLLGGGGGGGGGSYIDLGTFGDPGSGGGGGAGFSATNGGDAGIQSGLPPGIPGGNGGPNGPGAGGVAVTNQETNGGDGGNWGAGGKAGNTSDLIVTGGTAFHYYGGTGGRAGHAFLPSNGGSIVFNGAKSEATLRSEERLRGLITENYPILVSLRNVVDNESGSTTHGYRFEPDGDLIKINTGAGGNQTYSWTDSNEASFGDDFEVRIRNNANSQDQHGTWTAQPAAQGTWSALTANRTWSITVGAGEDTAAGLFEIRRADAPSGDIIDCGYMAITDLDLP